MRYLKKIKYLIMMLIFLSFSYSIEFDISEKQVKDGIVYRRGEKNSFTGVFIGENIREEYKKRSEEWEVYRSNKDRER